MISVTDSDGNEICSATVDANGDWSCDVDTSGLDDGENTLTATQTDAAGNTSDEDQH